MVSFAGEVQKHALAMVLCLDTQQSCPWSCSGGGTTVYRQRVKMWHALGVYGHHLYPPGGRLVNVLCLHQR